MSVLIERIMSDLFTTRNPNEFDANFVAMSMPANLLELGDSKVCRDYKISKHYLALQESNSRSYVQRRAHFYNVTRIVAIRMVYMSPPFRGPTLGIQRIGVITEWWNGGP
jgi:hypothetical protein